MRHPLRLTNSEMRTFKRCRRKWWLSTYRGLGPRRRDFNRPTGIGTRVHNALSVLYEPGGEGTGDPVAFLKASIAEDLARFPDEKANIEKEADLALAMVEGYVEWLEETGADRGFEVVASEGAREAVLYEDVTLLSKIDARIIHRERRDIRLALEHKGQPLDALVMTPTGPREMGDLRVGDTVIGSDGHGTRVVGVYPLGVQDLARVTFTDGTFLRTTWDHVWSTNAGLRMTSQLRSSHKIPRTAPVEFEDHDLPVPPYVLGVLLGDGILNPTQASFACADREIADEVCREIIPVRRWSGRRAPQFRELYGVVFGQEVTSWLQMWGLAEARAHTKFVPELYMVAPAQQRLELLQGLLDTDGSKNRQVRYSTSSRQLAEQVQWLVESLGGTFKLHEHTARVSWKGAQHPKRTSYSGTVQGLAHLPIFRVKRGLDALQVQKVERGRSVKSVASDGRAAAQCIKVAAKDQLYVTEHFIVTHNTVGDLSTPLPFLQIDTQLLTEHLVEFMALKAEGRDAETAQGVLYNMLRKCKRTSRAKPPFFGREEVKHNRYELEKHWMHVISIAQQIRQVEAALDAGASHHQVCDPNPTRDCRWDCPFFHACSHFDDGSDVEHDLAVDFEVGNPLQRYADSVGGLPGLTV